jgi:SNF2 family DNA or RNA helicase
MKEKNPIYLQRLKDLIRVTCLRRTKESVITTSTLPKPIETIESVTLHEKDQAVYDFFKAQASDMAATLAQGRSPQEKTNGGQMNVLSLINFLRLICNHGEHLLPRAALNAWKLKDTASIDWETMQQLRSRCEACGSDADETDSSTSATPNGCCEHLLCGGCATDYAETAVESSDPCSLCLVDDGSKNEPALVEVKRPSAKLEALLRNLHSLRDKTPPYSAERPTKRYVMETFRSSHPAR